MSKYGQLQFERYRSQQVQPHLEIKKVNEILIPILQKNTQQNIAKSINHAKMKMAEANKQYEQSEEHLLKLLNVKLSNINKTRFNVNFSELANSFSWSVEGHFREYSEIVESLRNTKYPIVKFGDLISLSKEKIDPEREPSKNYKYIELGNISSFGNIEGYAEFVGYSAPSRARMLLKKGDVLIPYLSASSDKIAVVTEEYDGFVGSTGFYIARSKKFDSWFLFTLLKNPIFQKQLEQRVTGTIMSSIPENLIRNILLPQIPREEQVEVSKEMELAFQLKKEGLDLIAKTIHQVEEFVNEYSLIGSQ